VGFAIAFYLSLYQWGLLKSVWDPFFGEGSRKILTQSWVSKLLPFPDAFMGALGYVGDALAGLIGGQERWKSMPWIVIVFGFLVGPLGAVSVLLVILQPVLFHAWCTLCLGSALISIFMIGPSFDEVLASLQYLSRTHTEGGSVWRHFWGLGENTEKKGLEPSCGLRF
jgi:hypothetical protein